jgi:hypothetical protein
VREVGQGWEGAQPNDDVRTGGLSGHMTPQAVLHQEVELD